MIPTPHAAPPEVVAETVGSGPPDPMGNSHSEIDSLMWPTPRNPTSLENVHETRWKSNPWKCFKWKIHMDHGCLCSVFFNENPHESNQEKSSKEWRWKCMKSPPRHLPPQKPPGPPPSLSSPPTAILPSVDILSASCETFADVARLPGDATHRKNITRCGYA